jgi:hypothetical protein
MRYALFATLCCFAVVSAGCGGTLTASPEASSPVEPRKTETQAPVATVPKTSAASRITISRADKASFAELMTRIGAQGEVAFQSLDGSAPQTVGSFAAPFAWSSIKPVILAQLLKDEGGEAQLSADQKANARAALTTSDNAAAMALFSDVASQHGGADGAAAAMTQLLRRAGDSQTQVSSVGRDGFSPYGQTLWTPSAQAKFVSSLARGCLLAAGSTDYVLGLMSEVTASQRWGFGVLPSVTVQKPGWGPDPDGSYEVRQIGLIESDAGSPIAFGAAVRGAGGSFGAGTSALSQVAEWSNGLSLRGASRANCAN